MELYDTFYDDLLDDKSDNTGIDKHVAKMNDEYKMSEPELIVSDYLSSMTDSYVLKTYMNRFLPVQYDEMIES